MDPRSKQKIIESYREAFHKYGSGPEVGQWSKEGQRFRFEKLIQIANLRSRSVLDLGCGSGELYPFLLERVGDVEYTGVDIVQEIVDHAAKMYPGARFHCLDLLSKEIHETFDYILISGMFNNAIPDCTDFLKEMCKLAFRHCSLGLGFNFLSTYHNFEDPGMSYHDPVDVVDFCLKNLTGKVTMHHHYERSDVIVFVYR